MALKATTNMGLKAINVQPKAPVKAGIKTIQDPATMMKNLTKGMRMPVRGNNKAGRMPNN